VLPTAEGVTIVQLGENHVRLVHTAPPEGVYRAIVTNQFGVAQCECRAMVEYPYGMDARAPPSLMRKLAVDEEVEEDASGVTEEKAAAVGETLKRAAAAGAGAKRKAEEAG
jgi:hypothetical protein